METTITQEHIDAAREAKENDDDYCSWLHCPIARAVGPDYQVFNRNIEDQIGELAFRLPAVAVDFVRDFDAGNEVEPFSFTAIKPTAQEIRDYKW